MNFRFSLITLLMLSAVTNAQINDSTVVKKQVIKDTIIDGQSQVKKVVVPVADSLSKKSLEDLKLAAEIDKKWLEELYSTSLYDTIYNGIRDLKYEPVYYPELPTDTLKKRLAELNARTPFNVEYNRSLESVIKGFLKNRKNHLERLMALSEYYFPMFESELDNNDIPLELKYLAIVESALKPRAKSRVGATGLWQFMFATGKMYGLNVSSYVDERSDPIKSTEAASKYLARLYKIFGDWDLALAAYNSGPGNVSKAIRRSGGSRNYWDIRSNLPRETAGYLPVFLATMYIFEYAEEHGFNPQKPEIAFIQTDTIHVKQMITLDQVSELLEVPIEELQFLNPSYKLDVIPHIKGKNYSLRLPREKIGIFVANENSIYKFVGAEFEKQEQPLPQFVDNETKLRYQVKSGDYLGKIARKYGVRVSQLKQWNGLRSNNLSIGQRLTIYPRKSGTQASSVVAKTSTTTKSVSTNAKTYKVQKGDSLWSISQKLQGVSVANLKEWNNINSSKLKIGMTLVVSKK